MALQASVGLQGFEVVLFRAVAFCSVLFDMVGPVLHAFGFRASGTTACFVQQSFGVQDLIIRIGLHCLGFRASGITASFGQQGFGVQDYIVFFKLSDLWDYSFFRATGFRCSGII